MSHEEQKNYLNKCKDLNRKYFFEIKIEKCQITLRKEIELSLDIGKTWNEAKFAMIISVNGYRSPHNC